MTATIMMVTYNRLELTKQTLESLFKTVDYPFNLVIVDNGSSDGSPEYLKALDRPANQFLKDISIKFNNENKGIAYGRNQALLMADKLDSEYYVCCDNDVMFPNGWLTECIEILKVNPKYGGIGVNYEPVQYPLVTLNGKTFQDKPKGNLGSATMVFPRSVHKFLGFFNYQEIGKYGLEDSLWGMRNRVAGFKLGYIKEPGVHLGEHETGEYREWKTKTHNEYLTKFNALCAAYYNKTKPIYIPFKEA